MVPVDVKHPVYLPTYWMALAWFVIASLQTHTCCGVGRGRDRTLDLRHQPLLTSLAMTDGRTTPTLWPAFNHTQIPKPPHPALDDTVQVEIGLRWLWQSHFFNSRHGFLTCERSSSEATESSESTSWLFCQSRHTWVWQEAKQNREHTHTHTHIPIHTSLICGTLDCSRSACWQCYGQVVPVLEGC